MSKNEFATFAGGCFWCMVRPFDEEPGIVSVVSGYTGGDTADPSYEEVKQGTSGHREAVQIEFEPAVFSYEKLLTIYWQQVDPTDDGGQFFDRGSQYRTAIFYHSDDQKAEAEASREHLEKHGPFQKPIVTEILPAQAFYPAEEEHQKFYKKNPEAYQQERIDSGRERFIQETWNK
ncbi:peptide-methionine (S)-S-oxide reductase MsrA [Alkalicoccus luteus]|uniref:peptide-methionine (S)-S-oxide reductase MsrA n=1 Tax=Alkalicoccus luteus TaxID=1237094 RepID=UPI0040344C5D